MSYGNLFSDNKGAPVQTVQQNKVLEGTFEPAQKQLPSVLTDADGRTFNMSISEISKFGTVRAQSSSELNNQLLQKTMVADSGVMGQNMMQVMALTEKVDLDALSDKGLFSKIRNRFQDAKLRVKAQYTTVEGQIDDVVKKLTTDIEAMRQEADWLQKVYEANKLDIIGFEKDLQVMQKFMKDCEEHVLYLQNSNASTNDVEEARLLLNAVSRQVDVLVKMKSIADLTAPEVRSLQVSNVQNIEKFNTIITATIPIWKKQMNIALQANLDRERIAYGNKLDNFTDDLIKNTAKQVGQNMIESTKASQSNVASADAIIEATATLTRDIQESIKLEKAGHETRKQNAAKIHAAVGDMKQALRGV